VLRLEREAKSLSTTSDIQDFLERDDVTLTGIRDLLNKEFP
jgi:hypothetical protein